MVNLRKLCMIAGVSERDFWDMTVGEALRVIETFKEQRRDRAYFAYTQAMTTGIYVASMFSKRQPPKLHDIYPDLFPEGEEAEEQAKTEASKAAFLKFAYAFNQRYGKNGDREPQSQSDG